MPVSYTHLDVYKRQILHGPKGCAYHYRYFARRRYLPAYNIESSDLNEADIVIGGEQKLHDLAVRLIHERHPGCVVLIPTVASEMCIRDSRLNWLTSTWKPRY